MAGGGSPVTIAADIIRKEGFLKLYTGLSAGVLRQITYTSSRLGIFKCAAAGAGGRRGGPLNCRRRSLAPPLALSLLVSFLFSRPICTQSARCPRS